MKVKIVMVTSLDGRITQGDEPGASSWASPEDQTFFLAQKNAADRIVMGSATYEAGRATIVPDPDKLRVVMTREPQRYTADEQPGLTFSSDSPEAIVQQAKDDGCDSLLVVGGAKTAAQFFNTGMVDELFLTLEPLLFGDGTPLVSGLTDTVRLEYLSYELLNNRGTILLHYAIQKDS